MASRGKVAAKVIGNLRICIGAGKASPSPPLGPALGQKGVNIGIFCKDFNEKTKHVKEGVPIPTIITIYSDRSYSFSTSSPPTSYFLKAAAGIEKGASKPGHEVTGKVTLKHIYEIACIKSKDHAFARTPLKNVCKSIIGSSKSLGIEVVR